MHWIETVRRCFLTEGIYYSHHARREMREEEFRPITDQELSEAVEKGAVIEEYSDDKPYPSALILGTTQADRPIHAVCAYDSDDEWKIIVTVYQPDPNRWVDFCRRKQ